jgi:hypothetical protein
MSRTGPGQPCEPEAPPSPTARRRSPPAAAASRAADATSSEPQAPSHAEHKSTTRPARAHREPDTSRKDESRPRLPPSWASKLGDRELTARRPIPIGVMHQIEGLTSSGTHSRLLPSREWAIHFGPPGRVACPAWLVSIRGRGWTTRATGMSCWSGSPTRGRACATWSGCVGAMVSAAASAGRSMAAGGRWPTGCVAARPVARRPRSRRARSSPAPERRW